MVQPILAKDISKSTPTDKSANTYTLLAAIFWGTSFIVVDLGLEFLNPFWFAQLRFFVASIGTFCLVLILKKPFGLKLFSNHWIWLLGLFNALGFLGQFLAQSMTFATKTALLINLYIVPVSIFSAVFLNEKFTKKKSVAVVFAFFGVFFLTTNGDLSSLSPGEFLGDMFALAAGISWTFYIITNKKVVIRPGTDVVLLTAGVMITTTIIMLPFTLLFGGININVFAIGYNGLGYVVYLGVFCNLVPFTLWTYGLKRLPATSSALILLTEVVVAAILAMIILNEFLTVIGFLGGGMILLAIIFIGYKSNAKDKKNNK